MEKMSESEKSKEYEKKPIITTNIFSVIAICTMEFLINREGSITFKKDDTSIISLVEFEDIFENPRLKKYKHNMLRLLDEMLHLGFFFYYGNTKEAKHLGYGFLLHSTHFLKA